MSFFKSCFNPKFTPENKIELKRILEKNKPLMEMLKDYKAVNKYWKKINILVDLTDNEQVIEVQWNRFKHKVLALLAHGGMEEGIINYDSDYGMVQVKGGKFKSQNGLGLLQKKSAATNKIQLGLNDTIKGLDLNAVSEDGDVSTNVGATLGPITIMAQNVVDDNRFITAYAEVLGAILNVETQDTGVGTNTAYSASIPGLMGVVIDVKDTTGVTQDDGILGDVSGANTGSTVKGAVASLNTTLGNVTGKVATVNDINTYTAELQRGVWTLGHSKTEDTDGVTTAKININF